MIRFIIGIVLTIVFGYFLVTSIQNAMKSQSDVDYWKSQIPKEKAYYASHGCTFNPSRESWTCDASVPTWVPPPR